jgi:general nucleoside transport system ATP-binding protein
VILPRAVGDDANALEMAGITKRFGDTIALDDASIRVRRGTVHGLLGENGAGKTTLMRIAFGLIAPDRGTISISGHRGRPASAADAIHAGLGMVHQHFTNVAAMTVAENVALGGAGRFNDASAAQRVEEIGARTGLSLDPAARAEALPVGALQRLEIVKALARGARTLILDEPTAVLAPREADELLAWLRRFADDGHTVVLITHKLHEALAIADDITVLRHGKVVTHSPAADLTSTSLAVALLGEDLAPARERALVNAEDLSLAPVIARARRVDVVDERGVTMIRDANLEIRRGEILGIAAVEGAGQRELLRAFASRIPVAAGEMELPLSIGFVPEDRQRDALVLDFSLVENVALRGAGARRGRVPWREMRARTAALVERFDVRGGGAGVRARALSGGNQQRFVIARELDGDPALLVVENPTRGLDIRAIRSVHERLAAVAASGTAVFVYSSDLDEVLSFATRIVAVHAGTLRDVPLDREAVGRAILGVA